MIAAMIDLETLDIVPQGQILTIGAVKFDPTNFKETHSDFYYRFNIDEQEAMGRTQNTETLDWWASQDAEIQEEAFHADRTDCREILQALKKWCVGVDRFWSQGSLDYNMLEDLQRQMGEPRPWAFYQLEDCRTMLNRMPVDPRKGQTFAAHNALADCKAQIDALRKTFKHFGMNK
jgi:hypothetical protein